MKKILIAIILSILLVGNTFASSKDEMDIYKKIILTRAQIEKDYTDGKEYNELLSKFFEKLRIQENISKVNDLDVKLSKLVSNYSGKALNIQDQKMFNLILNIYYRNKILKDYQLKNVRANNNSSSITINTNNKNNNSNKNNVIISNNKNNNSNKNNVIISNNNSSNNKITGNNSSNSSSISNIISSGNKINNTNNPIASGPKSTIIINDKERRNGKILVFLDSDGNINTSGSNKYKTISSSTNNNSEETKSFTTTDNLDFSYSYKIPRGWYKKSTEDDMAVHLESNYREKDYVKLFVTTIDTSFYNFRENFSENLRKLKLKDFSEPVAYSNGDSIYTFEYTLNNGDRKYVYIMEYKGLVFFIDTLRKYNNNSFSDIKEIIDSIKITKSEKQNNNVINSSNNNNDKNVTYSLSYSYKIPYRWEKRTTNNEGETIILNNNFSEKDIIVFNIASYDDNYNNFKNNFEKELKKDNSIRNFTESRSRIDGKEANIFNYNLRNGDEKSFYLVDYNGMVLVVDLTKKVNNNSTRDINEIINSIKIEK